MAAHIIWPNIWFNRHTSSVNYSVPQEVLDNAQFLIKKQRQKTAQIDVWSGSLGSGGLSDEMLANRTGPKPSLVAINNKRFSHRSLTPPADKKGPWEMLFHLRRGADTLSIAPHGPVFETAQDLMFHEIPLETRFWLHESDNPDLGAFYLKWQYALPHVPPKSDIKQTDNAPFKDAYYVGLGRVAVQPKTRTPRFRIDWAEWERPERCERWVNEPISPPLGKACVGHTDYGIVSMGSNGPVFESAAWGADEGLMWKSRRWMTRADLLWRRGLAAAAIVRIDEALKALD